MYLVDTNVLSELRRPERAAKAVLEWSSNVPATKRFLSAITVMELELGCLKTLRRDHPQGVMLDEWLRGQILPNFAGRILPVDAEVALRCARFTFPIPNQSVTR